MINLLKKTIKGVTVPGRKHTRDSHSHAMPIPDLVTIVMSQHMGPPCKPTVKRGSEVKVGQVIGEPTAQMAVPIHSSVSGKVKSIDSLAMPNGRRSTAIVIKTDKLQTVHEDIKPPIITDHASFIDAVYNSGVVGLGGAGFPVHIKLNPKKLSDIDTFVINAAECEPYLTSDYRTLMEQSDEILLGIDYICKYLNINNVIIGIENNKPEAIKLLQDKTANSAKITVQGLTERYPQGAEKVLVFETTERVVGEGQIPADVGVVVSNVTTVAKLASYFKTGMPLIDKCITVDGRAVANPQNVIVPIGTRIEDLIVFCGGYRSEPCKILYGGPMMGVAVYDQSYPIMKNTNGILAFDDQEAQYYEESPCIRCGRCVRVCPMNLMPLDLKDAFERNDLEELEELKINLCIECGCCSYVCPARQHLVQAHRLSKGRLRAKEQINNGKGA